jgi:hypothetical protein
MASTDIEELRNLRASGERRSLEVLRIAAKHWDQIHSLGNERKFFKKRSKRRH